MRDPNVQAVTSNDQIDKARIFVNSSTVSFDANAASATSFRPMVVEIAGCLCHRSSEPAAANRR